MSTVVTLGPVGFKPTGAYDNTREYKKLDVVTYQGSSYIAKSDSIGQLPTNTIYWELLVQKGDTGNGITSIAKTGTSGLVDTYTITYTDETTSTFTVTNGEKGDPGEVTEEQLDEAMARANMVYNALPKVSDEGDSLTLDGTANCPMKMELKGNTEQTTYTGKNLFDTTKYSSTANVTILDKNNGVLDLEGVSGYYEGVSQAFNVIPNQSYVLSYNAQLIDTSVASACYVRIREKDDITVIATNYNSGNQTISFTPTTDEINIHFRVNGETNKGHTKYSNIQLEQGSSFTYFEPYVGGTPSPNPDYPQDVRVVTGNNSVKVVGKNLVNYDNNTNLEAKFLNASGVFESAIYTYVNGTIKANSNKITISFNNSVGQGYVRIGEYKEDGTFIKRNLLSTTPTTLTLDSNTSYLIYSIDKNIDSYFKKLQIEEGNQATEYEPYHSQTYPINLGTIELCKIGTYQDYIYKDSGKWYKHSEIGKVVLDGSEAWYNTYGTNLFTLNAYFNNKHFIVGYGLSNYYNYNSIQSGINAGTINGEFVLQKSNVDYSIHIKNTTYSTPADFKTWLSTHNTIVYYPLETPTTEEITDTTLISQLNAIENAVSYDTQTNIVQENYSEPFIINAECVRSLKDIFELID